MLLAMIATAGIDFDREIRRAVGLEIERDSCGDSAAVSDRIIICGIRHHSNAFRIEESERSGPVQSSVPNPQRVNWRQVGATGTGSCSAVGPAGFTGCLMNQIGTWGRGGGIRF
jgi:hypothetical protein